MAGRGDTQVAVTITRHGYRRLRERLGLSRSAADRMIPRVWERGLQRGDARLFGEHWFIFRRNRLVTVFPVKSGEAVSCFLEGEHGG